MLPEPNSNDDDLIDFTRQAVYQELLGLAIDEPKAAEISETIAYRVRRNFSGLPIYIKSRKREIGLAVVKHFNGHNHAELARRFDLTETRIYQILRTAKKRRQHPK